MMLLYSTIARPLFWIVMGLIFALMIAGAPVWARDLGLQMTWWKWLLAAIWYALLSLGIAASFTLMGEKEPRAGQYTLGLTLVIMIILGVGLWSLL
jgi:hypothetical protein